RRVDVRARVTRGERRDVPPAVREPAHELRGVRRDAAHAVLHELLDVHADAHAYLAVRAARRYASRCAVAAASHVYGFACTGPRAAGARASSGSSARSMPAASASTSPGATSTAASPTNSSIDEPLVVTTGAPHASASSAGSPKPSSRAGCTNTAARRI